MGKSFFWYEESSSAFRCKETLESAHCRHHWDGNDASIKSWGESYLDGCEDYMCLACYSHDNRTLLDCLCGVFDLENPALWRAGELSSG